jgi:hypothetical protein
MPSAAGKEYAADLWARGRSPDLERVAVTTSKKKPLILVWLAALAFTSLALPAAARARWSEQTARDWYAQQPWLVGANYIPANAINQLEMWQADTFDPRRIDRELGWAESIGMNTMRVFLHDLLWQQDAAGFRQRIDTFLTIAARHHIKPMFVLFDSVWDPSPHVGKQHDPVPGIHNSGWVQSPGGAELANPARYPKLEGYARGVVRAFAKDPRILAWDVWNEPTVDAPLDSHWPAQEAPHKDELVRSLLPQAFKWARAANPSQPLTSGLYASGGWSSWDKWPRTAQIQIEESDVLSFHSYGRPEELTKRIESLLPYHRPILCTEYMARSAGSTFEGSLPILKKYHVGAINWGLVAGKTQTIYPWDSWDKPYTGEHQLPVWFHDVFQADGRPYRQEEVDLIRQLSGRGRDRSSD